MFEPKRVLLTTDLSPLSWKAWETAVSVAMRYEAPLFVLHVLETGKELDIDGDLRRAEDEIRSTLAKMPEKRSDGGLVEVVVAHSAHVERELLEQIERLDVDLVVTATHGRTGLSGIVYGSTAEKLVRTCPVPVVSVRVKELEEAPFDREVELARRKKMLGPLEGR